MSNYIEFNDTVVCHPGYYVKELVEESGLTQEDFAKRLGTTPKNLSVLINGEQSLSIEMASRLSRMLGTTVAYWLNLQRYYDEVRAEYLSEKELGREREVFQYIDYSYFRKHFSLPDLPRKIDEQIKCVREFLSVFSLSVLRRSDMVCSFRSYSDELSISNIVNANVMVQIAVNMALHTESPRFEKQKFKKAVEFCLTQTENHDSFLPVVREEFRNAGVILVVLPNLKNSGINGATKRVDGRMLLMVNDRRHYADTFWFTLFHEIGHIINGDSGITFEKNREKCESDADKYAQQKLVPEEEYQQFINDTEVFDEASIRNFAHQIHRDPGIVFGRLQNDGKIPYTNSSLGKQLRHTYEVVMNE